MQDWIGAVALVGAAALALVALGLAVALVRTRSRTEEALERSAAETASLREQLATLERRLDRPVPSQEQAAGPSFVITDLGTAEQTSEAEQPAPQIGAALFADLVLRESVVKAASLAHGVRRALDAETRHRIRFEMKREVKRARKQRKSDTREARREFAARQRATMDGEDAA